MKNKEIKEEVFKEFLGTNLNILKLPNTAFPLNVKQLEEIIDLVVELKEQEQEE